MDFPNQDWTPTKNGYAADCSTLNIGPGIHPSASFEARDPWHRELPHITVVWTSHRNADNETTHWTTTVRAPDGVAVVLTVYND